MFIGRLDRYAICLKFLRFFHVTLIVELLATIRANSTHAHRPRSYNNPVYGVGCCQPRFQGLFSELRFAQLTSTVLQ